MRKWPHSLQVDARSGTLAVLVSCLSCFVALPCCCRFQRTWGRRVQGLQSCGDVLCPGGRGRHGCKLPYSLLTEKRSLFIPCPLPMMYWYFLQPCFWRMAGEIHKHIQNMPRVWVSERIKHIDAYPFALMRHECFLACFSYILELLKIFLF